MNRPLPADLNQILDKCLLRLQAGETLESILADYPAVIDDLRPALETVIAIWSVRGSDTVPLAAIMRSRSQLINAAHRLNTVPRSSLWQVQWVLFTGFLSRTRPVQVLLAAVILIASLLFSGLASAQALPGEAFYPVKIAAEQIGLSLAGSPSDRLEREETYDLRRKEEVETLITQNREVEVYFTGFLTRSDTQEWWIDEIKITMPAEMISDAQVLENHYVYLHADLLPHGELIVEWFEARVYFITGRIATLESQRVLVGDVWLKFDQNSQVSQPLQMGQTVRASVTRIQSEDLVALKIEVIGQAPTPTHTRAVPVIQPSETAQPEAGGENSPADQQDEPDEPYQPEKPDQPDSPDSPDPEKDNHNDDNNENDEADEAQKSTSESDHDDDEDKLTSTAENPERTPTPEPTRRRKR